MSHRVITLVGMLTIVFSAARLPNPVAQDLERWSPRADVPTQASEGKILPTACEGCLPKTAKPKGWKTPRTPWGDPDLQGIWNDATITPFQRPGGRFGEKAVLDEEDAEEILETVSRDRRDGRGTPEDVDRAYNDHWMDHGTVVPDKRTSLITDPPDGRIPPLTPEAQKKIAAAADSRARFLAGMPYGPEELSLAVRCIIGQDVSPYRPSTYNTTFQIFQSPGYVVIAVEMIHYEYSCHESNYDMMHLLSGARIREKAGEVAPSRSSK